MEGTHGRARGIGRTRVKKCELVVLSPDTGRGALFSAIWARTLVLKKKTAEVRTVGRLAASAAPSRPSDATPAGGVLGLPSSSAEACRR